MAYTLDEEEDKKPEEQNALTGAVAPTSGGATSAPASAPAAEPDTGSGFVSFDRYYGANQAGAENTAGQLANAASASADNASTAINTAGENVRSGAGIKDPDTVGGHLGRSGSATKGTAPSSTPTTIQSLPKANPSETIISQEQRDMSGIAGTTPAEARANAVPKYTVPGSLLDAQFGQPLYDQVGKADQQVASLQSQDGLQAAMHGADSSVGSELDAALVNRAGAGRFGALKEKYGSLSSLLSRRRGDAGSLVAGVNGANQAYADKWKGISDGLGPDKPWVRQNTSVGATEPTKEHPNGTYIYHGPEGDEVRDYPSSNHVTASEDPTGTSAQVAGVMNEVGPAILGAINPALGAGAKAAVMANQGYANASAADQKKMWGKWSAEAKAKWDTDHPQGPAYKVLTYEELMAGD